MGLEAQGPSCDEQDLQAPSGLARAGPGHPVTPLGPFNRLAGYGVSSIGWALGVFASMAIMPRVSRFG